MPVHYTPRKISEIKKSDSKIALVGEVVQVSENEFVLQDDSGKVKIFSEENVEPKNILRVFCSVVGNELKADAIQSLNGFDVKLYNKVKELYTKAGL